MSPWAGGFPAGSNDQGNNLSMNLLGSLMNNASSGSGNMANLATSLVAQALQNKPGGMLIGGNHFGGQSYNDSRLIGRIHYDRWDIEEMHPINVGRNLFGVASCMAFLKVIFHLSIHYKFGPILFCIKQVNTKISKIVENS